MRSNSVVEELERRKQEMKHVIDKVGNYGKYVKEMYWPKTSEKKKLEL